MLHATLLCTNKASCLRI